jgi:peptide-methionine (S)-S-oxide reductase
MRRATFILTGPAILAAWSTGLLLHAAGCSNSREAIMAPNDSGDRPDETEVPQGEQVATFAAGCFWGVEAEFRKIPGVTATQVGYTGGHTPEPTYEQVCSDRTGHAEAVRVTYDPEQVRYDELLDAFWRMHDPTTANRQGPDVGSQYRSAIFYHDPEQEQTARASKRQLEQANRFRRPISTEITEAGLWWPAEDYHQRYLEKRGQASCHTGLK